MFNIDDEEIQQACDKLYNHFEKPLTANGFIKQRIRELCLKNFVWEWGLLIFLQIFNVFLLTFKC